MKTFDKNTDPNLIKRALDAGLSSTPGIAIVWELSKALYGNALELRQQRALEWVEMIRDNPNVFRKDLLESTEFQDGFIVALEDYLKIRTILKRAMARKIFTDFAQTTDMEQFELERYNATLRQISSDSLEFLRYLELTVVPRQKERVRSTLDTIDFDRSPIQIEQAQVLITKQNPLAFAYKDLQTSLGNQMMLPNKPDPQYPTMQSSMGVTIQDQTKLKHEQCLNELVSLSILTRTRYTTPVSNTNPEIVYHDIWDYTDYGMGFVAFVKDAA
jgi:hypothetical protein